MCCKPVLYISKGSFLLRMEKETEGSGWVGTTGLPINQRWTLPLLCLHLWYTLFRKKVWFTRFLLLHHCLSINKAWIPVLATLPHWVPKSNMKSCIAVKQLFLAPSDFALIWWRGCCSHYLILAVFGTYMARFTRASDSSLVLDYCTHYQVFVCMYVCIYVTYDMLRFFLGIL